MTKEYVEERYNLLFELYGVQSRGWSMLHEQISYKEYAVIKPYLIKEENNLPLFIINIKV